MPPRPNPSRWVILTLCCVVLFGSYYCYDNPAALHDQLHDQLVPSAITSTAFEYYFSLFYTAYSVPNVVLPFFGGLLADRWGAARCASLCVVCITIGQLVVSAGVSFQSVSLIVFGRVLFGVGGESLCVAISALLQQVFAGAEVGLAMGLNLSVSRLGSVINNVVSPYLAFTSGGVVAPFLFGAGLCVLSLFSALALIPMSISNITSQDSNQNQNANDNHVDVNDSDASVGSAFSEDEENEFSPNKLRTPRIPRNRNGGNQNNSSESILRCCSFGSRFYLMVGSCIVVYGTVLPFNNVASALLIEKYICHGQCCPAASTTISSSLLIEIDATPRKKGNIETKLKQKARASKPNRQKEKLKLDVVSTTTTTVDATRSPTNIDTHSAINSATAAATSTTTTTPVAPLPHRHHQCSRAIEAEAQASYVMGIPFLVSALMTPFIGLFADRFGGASTLTLTSPFILVLVHCLLITTTIVPIFPLVAQGIAYSMYAAALWPLIGRAVRKEDVGTAYGVTTALQNIGLATIPPVVASLRVKNGNYDSVESLFIVLSISGVVFGLGLLLVDGTYYHCMLNRPLRLTAADDTTTTTNSSRNSNNNSNSHQARRRRRRRLSEYDHEIPSDFFDDQRIREEATSLLEAEGASSSFVNDEQENSMDYGIN